MSHLFLTSSVGVEGVGESIRRHIVNSRPLKTAFITTPIEGDSDRSDLEWVREDHDGLNNNGFIAFDYTITGKSLAQIKQDLSSIEVLYISGGNEFYLREKCNENNFDTFVHEFVASGGIYIGTSAGSIIAGDDMSALENPGDLKSLRLPPDPRGFGLVNFAILPHWGSPDFQDRWLNEDCFRKMFNDAIPLIALNNYQYIEVQGSNWKIIDVRHEL